MDDLPAAAASTTRGWKFFTTRNNLQLASPIIYHVSGVQVPVYLPVLFREQHTTPRRCNTHLPRPPDHPNSRNCILGVVLLPHGPRRRGGCRRRRILTAAEFLGGGPRVNTPGPVLPCSLSTPTGSLCSSHLRWILVVNPVLDYHLDTLTRHDHPLR